MKIRHNVLHLCLILSLTFSNILIAADNKVIYLIRHAEKQQDGTKDPGLTKEGKIRAKNIARQLSDKKITAIYSTDYRRTRNTAKPLALLLNLPISTYDPANLDLFAKTILRSQQTVLIVGHSNTTPELVSLLGGNSFGSIGDSVYDRLYKVSVQAGETKTVLLKTSKSDLFDE